MDSVGSQAPAGPHGEHGGCLSAETLETLQELDPSCGPLPMTPAGAGAVVTLGQEDTPAVHVGICPPPSGQSATVAGPGPPASAAARRLVGYTVLLVALIGCSSIGPIADIMTDATSTTILFWRTQCMIMFSISGMGVQWVYRQVVQRHRRKATAVTERTSLVGAIKPKLDSAAEGVAPATAQAEDKQVADTQSECAPWMVVVYSLSYAAWSSSFFVALKLTSVLAAYQFNQSHIVIVLAARLIKCKRLPALQYIAAVLTVAGVTLMVQGGETAPRLLGNAVAFGGSFLALPFLAYAPRVQRRYGLMCTSLAMQLGILALVMAVNAFNMTRWGDASDVINFAAPFEQASGALAWVLPRANRLIPALTMVALGSIVGMLGYTLASSMVPAIIVQAAMLVEPGVSSIVAVLAKTGVMPSPLAYVGMVLLLAASVMVLVTEDTGDHTDSAEEGDHAKRGRGAGKWKQTGHRASGSSLDTPESTAYYCVVPTADECAHQAQEALRLPGHSKQLDRDPSCTSTVYGSV